MVWLEYLHRHCQWNNRANTKCNTQIKCHWIRSNWFDEFIQSQLVTRGSFSIRLFSYQLRLDKHVQERIVAYLHLSSKENADRHWFDLSFIYSNNVLLKVSLQLYPYSNWIKGQNVSLLSLFVVSGLIVINSSGIDLKEKDNQYPLITTIENSLHWQFETDSKFIEMDICLDVRSNEDNIWVSCV